MSPDRPDGPVTAATADLVAWLHDATGTEVHVGPPRSIEETESAITAWPLELRPDQEARGTGPRMPMRLVLRCLVCASGAGEAGVRLLDRALAAAADADQIVVLDPLPAQTWLAFGVAPRPALLFDTPLQIARTTPTAPLIRHPMQVETMAILAVHGRVLGPGDVPLADMRVEVASTGHVARTDVDGRFVLGGVPAGEPARLRVQGRGRYLLAQVDAPSADPVVIHCDFEEA